MFQAFFMIYVSGNEAVCCEVQMYFERFWLVRFSKKCSGCIFMIYASKIKAVCCKFRCILDVFGSQGF